jgi:hypothetical protein
LCGNSAESRNSNTIFAAKERKERRDKILRRFSLRISGKIFRSVFPDDK